MGLTHFSILNGLSPGIEFTVIEPNRFVRFFLKRNLDADVLPNDKNLKDAFDLTLITTPPSSHKNIVDHALARGDERIFVEKPFGGHSNTAPIPDEVHDRIRVGYVLRFNPCVQWLKNNLEVGEIKSVRGQYVSNSLQKKPEGWRNGIFSGALNEMGSHIIDLIYYLIEDKNLEVVSAKKESVISDVDDVVEARLKGSSGTKVSLYVNWVMKGLRKPIFSLEVTMFDGSSYYLDQQQIKIYDSGGELTKIISIANLAAAVPFYIRGIDFTKQMCELLDGHFIMANAYDALKVNQLIKNILDYEDHSR